MTENSHEHNQEEKHTHQDHTAHSVSRVTGGSHGGQNSHSEHIHHNTGQMPAGHMMTGSSKTGHRAHVDHRGHEQIFRQRFWICLALTFPVLLYSPMLQDWLGFTIASFPGSNWIVPLFSLVIFAVGGIPFLKMAIPELRNREPGMMTLISLAIGVAFIYSLMATLSRLGESFYWELVTLIDVMLLGHWLEMRSIHQASRALDELARLMPDTAERIDESNESIATVPISHLAKGDLLLIRPGASVPADGLVEQGESEVNEAMLTGESKPIKKGPGDHLIAGTINTDGSLRVRVTATGGETALAGIMRLVEQAQQSKSRAQLLADRAASWLFYTALIVAALTALAWWAAAGFGLETVQRVVTVLVIACPHALGLAIPLVVAITTSLGAQSGILVRDRLALEAAREVNVVMFDKTGTLTKGEQGLVSFTTVDTKDKAFVLALAAAVEADSEHIIARAIRKAAQEQDLELPEVRAFEALKGRGVRASLDGKRVYIGGPSLLEMLGFGLPQPLEDFSREAGSKGQTVVYLIEEGRVTAAFSLADVVRPESKAAVERLHRMGIEVAMLTGDSQAVARAVADELGIDRYFAEVLPEDKDKAIIELQRRGKKVAMVGDGVNDAPALVRADVGIAIGSGTDVAIESAGIILVKNNPLDVVKVIELSRASYRKMIQNLVWATGYNVVALPLAAGALAPWGVLLSPAIGALFMSLSTVIVAANAQLLRRIAL